MVVFECADCGKRVESSAASEVCPHCGKPMAVAPSVPLGATAAWTSEKPFASSSQPPSPSQTFRGASDTPLPSPSNTILQFLEPPRAAGELGWMSSYRVLRLLGQGGMGQVFEAIDTELERPVALKIMIPEQARNQEGRQRFLREARATAALRNDHIVTIYRVGQQGDIPYIAMELLHGEPLDRRLAREPRLPTAEVIRISKEIADGLAIAHERGLIHRDIKPANIWLEAETGRVKILDFGLARAALDSAHLTRTGLIMGTPAYMAPEQADGQQVDGRADLFSLGCVMYQMATGETPFQGATAMSVLRAIMIQEPKSAIEVNPEVPAALSALLNRLLAKDPNDRPRSASLLAVTIAKIDQNPNQSLSALGLPHVRSRRPWLWGAVAAVVLAAVASAAFYWGRDTRGPASVSAATESAKPPDVARVIGPGVTDQEITFGMSGPFSGSSRELGQGMKLGIETYFQEANAAGGIAGRKLRLVALDDGYEPDRALANMVDLKEKRNVFGVIGNVGTPTAEKTLPYALENRLLFFGAYTGAGLLRKDPPDRYVFNYRASYGEETAAITGYLVEIKKIKPETIAVFAQQDSYGQAGFDGAARALRKYGRDSAAIVRVGHQRNSSDVSDAVAELSRHPEIRAIIMVTTYGPAARFIQRMRDAKYTGLLTNVSFVGSVPLAEELKQLGSMYADGIIVTQVVPPVDSQSSVVLKFRKSMSRYFPDQEPGFTSLEGYIDAVLLAEALRRAGGGLTTESLIDALESLRGVDIGTGAPLSFGPSEHQASHKVWGTKLDKEGKYHVIELD